MPSLPDRGFHNFRVPTYKGPVAHGNTITLKYIDDTTTLTTIPMSEAIRHIGPARPTELIDASEVEEVFTGIIEKSEEIGMLVNCTKTQLLCISTDSGYHTSAQITVNGKEIHSTEAIKLLGFMISADQGMAA